ncbi:MAG: hypothetical protein AB1515_01970 [Nitrospirota bacterium]
MSRWLLVAALGGLLGWPAGGAAFPGDSAETMIQRLGPPASGYESPPVLDWARAREAMYPHVRLHWMDPAYDPLRSGLTMQGVVVALYDLDPAQLPLTQPENGKIGPVPWRHLSSRREIFMTNISPEQFAKLLVGVSRDWTAQSLSHHENARRRFDLYGFRSRDGRYQAQLSYSEPAAIKPAPAAMDGPAPPTFNLWIQVERPVPLHPAPSR